MDEKRTSIAAQEIANELAKRSAGAPDAVQGLLAIQLRNIEAFANAQEKIIGGSRSLFEQQMETFKSTAEKALKAAHEIMSEPSPRATLRRSFNVIKASIQDGIGNANTLTEMSARSSAEAAQIIQNRAFEALDEVEAVFEKMLRALPEETLGRHR